MGFSNLGNHSRRGFLKTTGKAATGIAVVGGGFAGYSRADYVEGTASVLGDDIKVTYSGNDDVSQRGRRGLVEVGVAEHYAEAESGTQDYWSVQFDTLLNGYGWDKTRNELYNGVLRSDVTVSAGSDPDRWITGDNKYWIGATKDLYDPSENYQHAQAVASGAMGYIPILGDALGALQILRHLLDWATNRGDSEIIDRWWDFSSCPCLPYGDGVKQISVFNRFDAELDPGERRGATVIQDMSLKDSKKFPFTPNVELQVNTQSPRYSPLDLDGLSPDQLRKRGVRAVTTEQIKRNPFAYGKSPQEAADLDSGNLYYFAPTN
jgi:hypothetical protein